MTAATQYLKKENLLPWLESLSKDYSVTVPKKEGTSVVYGPFTTKEDVCLDTMPTLSPKQALFPQSETLLEFRYKKDPENPSKTDVAIREILPLAKNIFFGARPCGIHGITSLDQVFLQGKFNDVYVQSRYDNTTFITLACAKRFDACCFCHWMHGGPTDSKGSDILLIPLEKGYLVEAHTKKGEALIKKNSLLEKADACIKEAETIKTQALESMGDIPPCFDDLAKNLIELFDDAEFWEEIAAPCINCGTCTYLCPTCHCFDINDEQAGLTGKRCRSWDTCMSSLYTREASGHNPRAGRAQRVKNRANHKFSYAPGLQGKEFSCTGCGRCIRHCPVSLDIRQIITKAVSAHCTLDS